MALRRRARSRIRSLRTSSLGFAKYSISRVTKAATAADAKMLAQRTCDASMAPAHLA